VSETNGFSFPAPRGVSRRRLSDQVAQNLREMILVGELLPDRNITQDELALQLGVSTTPVREALLRLVAEGFVRASPNRAFTVVRSTSADVLDVYWMHQMLSSELARRACSRMDRETLAEIRRHADQGQHAVRIGDRVGQEKANWSFHRTINIAADAPRLQLALATALKFIPRGFHESLPSWAERSVEDHEQIVGALMAGDAEAAADATAAHVHAAAQAVLSFLADSGYWRMPAGEQ
jgi:DNA-binding GntR family transcriptional regulator